MPRKSQLTTDTIVSYLSETYGDEFGSDAIRSASSTFGVSVPTVVKRLEKYKTGRGKWDLSVTELEQAYQAPAAVTSESMVPLKQESYVPFGNFADVYKVIKSNIFYPVFITGLSGNGKTLSAEQACAKAGREMIRVNITIETDEDDLLGGFRLVDGATVWHNGPVIEALERGAILLLDEVDLASNKILCLQSILEGKGVFLKKIGKYVTPMEGFNVIATANTKGKGSDDGRFIGTNVLNEAFLERFPITFEQSYPSAVTESKILLNVGCDVDFAEKLVKWANAIRKTFYDGGVDEIITTRRLVHISQAYDIFGDRLKAVNCCINRFDDDTKQSFLDLYSMVDSGEETEYTTDEEIFSELSPS
ncbi:porphyrin biosynthetic protein [Synechococcus phage ACG-2014d]|uniref:Porphyrin biosynthetic protein n=1 Tax=Synechococcus phage ACG-2014d TaxID=1493509 RepID=A0A0E3I049_9CAUD|nr:porphyrin biosynthetic protein [Synechococcus phage ACG-2014d]